MAFASNTALIDDFNRADQSPPGAPWNSAASFVWPNPLKIESNTLKGVAGGSKLSATYGADVDFYFTVVVVAPGEIYAYLRANPTTSSYTGYRLDFLLGFSIVRMWRVDAGTFTQIGDNVANTYPNAGDKFGIEVRGGTFKVYKDTGSGWTLFTTFTDGSPVNTSGGAFGIALNNSTLAVDNLSGGNAIVGGTPVLGSASLQSESNLTVSGLKALLAHSALSSESALTASAIKQLRGISSLSSESSLVISPGRITPAVLNLVSESDLITIGKKILLGQSNWASDSVLSVSSNIVRQGQYLITGSAILSAESFLTVTAYIPTSEVFGQAFFSGEAELQIDLLTIRGGIAQLVGTSDLIISGSFVIPQANRSTYRLKPGQLLTARAGTVLKPKTGKIQSSKTGTIL
jgi:hypothetical protein